MGPHSDTIHTLLWIPQPYPLTLRHSTHLRAIITITYYELSSLFTQSVSLSSCLSPRANGLRLWEFEAPSQALTRCHHLSLDHFCLINKPVVATHTQWDRLRPQRFNKSLSSARSSRLALPKKASRIKPWGPVGAVGRCLLGALSPYLGPGL